MKYTEKQLADAIAALLQIIVDAGMDDKVEEVCNQHQCVEEVNLFGPDGPVGLGLGRFGGHAV